MKELDLVSSILILFP